MMNVFDKSNFDKEVLESELPVIVDFYADWCMPCKMMAPVMAQVTGEQNGKIKVGKINIDENTDIAMKYRVLSIPALLFFKNGEVIGRMEGAEPKANVDQKIKKIFGM